MVTLVVLLNILFDSIYMSQVNGQWSTVYRQDTTINEMLCLWYGGSYCDCQSTKRLLEDSSFYLTRSMVYEDSIMSEAYMGLNKLPYAMFFNENRTEYLQVSIFHGSSIGCWSQFYVGRITDNFLKHNTHPYIVTKQKHFFTESGVHLGMREEEVIKLKGDIFQRETNIMTYWYLSNDDTNFFEDDDMQYYLTKKNGDMFMRFLIENGQVAGYTFGYIEP